MGRLRREAHRSLEKKSVNEKMLELIQEAAEASELNGWKSPDHGTYLNKITTRLPCAIVHIVCALLY